MPELEHMIEEVKKFLKDVGEYLSITLKKEKLKKETNAKREELLKDVESILIKLSPPLIEEEEEEQEEYADVDLPVSPSSEHIQEEEDLEELYEDTVPAESTHSNDSSHNSEEDRDEQDDKIGTIDLDGDPYGDVKVNPVAASDLTSPSKEGFLDKKRKEGQFGLQSWQKRYCIIKANVLYYYKKKTDKEQCNQIVLTGYQGREAPEFEKKNKRKDCLFEVVCPAKRSYQFIAQNKKEMHVWIKAIAVASKLAPSSIDPLAKSTPNNSGGSEELLEDYDDTSIPALSNEANDDDDGYGETYEELDNYQSTKMANLPPPEIPVTKIEEEEDVEPIDEEIYEDVSQPSDSLPPPVPATVPIRPAKSAASLPLPPEPSIPPPVPITHRPPPQLPTVEKQPAAPYSPRTQIKTVQGKNVKNLKNDAKSSVRGGKAPPPVPNRSETTSLPKKELWEEDYENIYIGLWDCMADDKDELEFKRGEMVHIISKEYDTFSWWIGERNNKVGLVPKDYLMKAYMI